MNVPNGLTFFFFFISMILFSCNQVQELATINCHMQSPVNIIPGTDTSTTHKVIVHYQQSKERVANLGHTVKIDYDSGSWIIYDNKTYQFKQFHFHTPSEHQVSGSSYDMEMHIVHTYKTDEMEVPDYLVLGVFFERGEENEFLNSFLSVIPKEEGEVYESSKVHIDASEMIPNELHDFYNYKGSLTTPPFTESVNWIVLKEVKRASDIQISRIEQIEGNNARKVQFLYDRKIESVN